MAGAHGEEPVHFMAAGGKQIKEGARIPNPLKDMAPMTYLPPTRPRLLKVLPTPNILQAGDQVFNTWPLGDTSKLEQYLSPVRLNWLFKNYPTIINPGFDTCHACKGGIFLILTTTSIAQGTCPFFIKHLE